MTGQEILDYFKNEVYQGHPEYELELIAVDGSHHPYLIVHLGNEKHYCFLVIPDATNKPFEQIKPSKDQLEDFKRTDLFPNCVLKKVMVVKKTESGFERRRYLPEHFDES